MGLEIHLLTCYARKIKAQQLARLEAVRNEQKAILEKDTDMSRERRLEFLLRQADVFSHFTSNATEAAPKKKRGRKPKPKTPVDNAANEAAAEQLVEAVAGAGSSSKAQSRARMSEEAEDGSLMKEVKFPCSLHTYIYINTRTYVMCM